MARKPLSAGPEPAQPLILVCVACNEEFVFTVEAQVYFAEKGYTEPPRRCKSCHHEYKAAQRGETVQALPSA